jgi:FAD/FMN-containing dehydrogenase
MVWCRPGEPCWPTDADWQRLRGQLHGALEAAPVPWQPCRADAAGAACSSVLASMHNPFYLQDQPGGTETVGWLGAWTAAPSAYAIAAQTAGDIAAGVDFARDHHLRLVIKGTGHDYLGRSNAPDSLLIWTHQMRQITVYDAFVARGCAAQTAAPAVTVEAGTRWLEVYQEVTNRRGRYVQGGGCTSVGAAGGFLQGGGFGSWSKKYGIAAAGLIEAEVVTADGKLITANACQHADLLWALRGGGGGTFGVVTKATLMTHPLPDYLGSLSGVITASSDAAFRELLVHFLAFYRDHLNNEHWGEQVEIAGNNSLRLSLAFQGMRSADAERTWQPFRAWIAEHADRFAIELSTHDLVARQMWSHEFFARYAPEVIREDTRSGAPPGHFWWAGDAEQVAVYLHAYHSRWIPIDQLDDARAPALAAALFDASRQFSVSLHINKGQSGASADAVARDRETAMNPAVLNAAMLAIIATGGSGIPGLPGHEPDRAAAEASRAKVDAAMQRLRSATPGAGSYINETDYFEPDWQHAFWGDNYPKLLAIKRAYDPHNLFTCHHCVGSEAFGR